MLDPSRSSVTDESNDSLTETEEGVPLVSSPSMWGRDWRDPSRYLIVVSLLVGAYALLQILLMGFGRDQGIYATVAQTVCDGGMPYRDAWDFKPPGVYLVYLLSCLLFGRAEWGIRLIEVAAFASLVPAMAKITRRLVGDPRPGVVGAVLAMIIESELEFWHTAQPESFGGVLTVWGIALAMAGLEKTDSKARWLRWVGAGLVFGLASWMKPHLLGGPAVTALGAAWLRYRDNQDRREALEPIFGIGAGTSVVILAVIGWFLARGAWHDFHETLFVFAPGYAKTTWRPRYVLDFIYSATAGWSVGFSALIASGLLLSAAAVRPKDENGRVWLLVIVVAAGLQLVGIGIQSKFFPYHYGATLPMGALLAAPGLWWLWDRSRQWHQSWGAVGFLLIVAAALQARGATRDLRDSWWDRSLMRMQWLVAPQEQRQRIDAQLYSVADVDYGANNEVARWIDAHTRPEDKVFIWGFEPYIYWKARRACASRFIYNVAQRSAWQRQWARDLLMQELRRNPPAVFVVERRDVFPVVTGDTLDSKDSLQRFWALKTWLADNYVLADTIQDFELYLPRQPKP